ncbi:hypothetical protein A4X13_0g9330 [Tilletia indica]|uniref:Uncharacterized protein n=1 Tax=Tilletia indica TaxID=43049 RepID=A0A8T8SAF1_9BASI|nr:hypothetical protein A4X13_0g9330 [Tilletia indica]
MLVLPSTTQRASSEPPPSQAPPPPVAPTDVERLAKLTRTNPAAAEAARALITAGRSIGQAVDMMESVVQAQATPARKVSAQGNHATPATPNTVRRSGSEPPTPTAKQTNKRPADKEVAREKAKKARHVPRHRAVSPEYDTEEEDDGLDLDPTRVNTASYAAKWPADRIVKQVRAHNYVPMWYFTDAGCALAAKERKDGTSQSIFVQLDGGLKPTGHPDSLVVDHQLSPYDFGCAASLWVDVATRIGVSKRMVDSMVLLNAKLLTSALWRQDPVIAMRWHDHQRSTWAEKRHQKNHFTLDALDKEALEEIRVATAKEEKAEGEARAARLEALLQTLLAGQASGSQAQSKGNNFRSAGGAGPSHSSRGAANTHSGGLSACLRCGSTHQHKVNKCLPAKRVDGSALTLVADPSWTNAVKFADNGDRICINYNTSSCPGCRNRHRCTWCGSQGHGHQQCPTAPHRA